MPDNTRVNTKEDAVHLAKVRERGSGERHYALWSQAEHLWHVTDNMPLLGEWYDADGIRHG